MEMYEKLCDVGAVLSQTNPHTGIPVLHTYTHTHTPLYGANSQHAINPAQDKQHNKGYKKEAAVLRAIKNLEVHQTV